MSPLMLEFIGVVLRWLLSSLGAYAVAHHILNAEQEARFSDGAWAYIMGHAAMWAPIALSLLWGLWAKYRSRLRFLAALELPRGSSEADAGRLASTAAIKSQAFTEV